MSSPLSEYDFQGQVVALAKLFGWRGYHTWLSVRSAQGFPDFVLVRPPRLVFAELKSAKGKLTPLQEQWIAALSKCPGVEVYVWKPVDWPTIEEVLR